MPKKYSEEQRKTAIGDYIEGFSVTFISEKYGLSRNSVLSWIKNYGFIEDKVTEECVPIQYNDFRRCPDCNSIRINDVTYKTSKKQEDQAAYCLDCSAEWYLAKGEVRKLNWCMY